MDLNFKIKSVEQCAETIMEFIDESQTGFWADPFYSFYPDIDRAKLEMMPHAEKRKFLIEYFNNFAQENNELLKENVEKYSANWQRRKGQITEALESAFSVELNGLFNDMTGYISFCPICPRYLSERTFDVFYLNSENGALGISLHEIIHFVWFYVWNNVFHDDACEYETPHMKWILSEMAVDLIMRDERLSSINPYFEEGCAYSYFYTMKINGEPILETLYSMYKDSNIQDFMKESYAFCLRNEEQIRAHIEKSENNGET